jgi:hypothetical protein
MHDQLSAMNLNQDTLPQLIRGAPRNKHSTYQFYVESCAELLEPIYALVLPICWPTLTARHNLSLGMNAEGIFLCERIFGVSITNSEGKEIPVRYIGEQHVKEDLGRIPTAQDWLTRIKPERWMYGQRFQV